MKMRYLYFLLFAAVVAVSCIREPLMSEEKPQPKEEIQAIVLGKAIVLFTEDFMSTAP